MPYTSHGPSHLGTPATTIHQVKGVPIFSGGADCRLDIEDWIKDVQYLLEASSVPSTLQFSTIVRHLGGGARKLVLNLPLNEQYMARVFEELRAEYSDCHLSFDPMADFYERRQRPQETATEYAIELEALLRTIEDRIYHNRPFPDRDYKLTQQFMRGVKDREARERIAPMRPRYMKFRELQAELRQLTRERMSSGGSNKTRNAQSLPQMAKEAGPARGQSTTTAPEAGLSQEQAILNLSALVQEMAANQRKFEDKIGGWEKNCATNMAYPTRGGRGYSRTPPYPGAGRPNEPVVCFNCGQEGHIKRGCRNPTVPTHPKGASTVDPPPLN